MEIPAAATSYNDDDVVNAVNAAFQEIWSAPNAYYRRKTGTFNTVASTEAYAITATYQEIFNPVSIAGKQLRPCRNRGEFDHYATRFGGAATDPADEGEPVAYFVESKNAAGAAELASVEMLLTPVPDAIYTVTYDYSTEAPVYTTALMDDAADMEFPHKYCESILLPIATKWMATQSHWFHNTYGENSRDRDAIVDAAYAKARAMLGYVDPQTAEATPRKERTT